MLGRRARGRRGPKLATPFARALRIQANAQQPASMPIISTSHASKRLWSLQSSDTNTLRIFTNRSAGVDSSVALRRLSQQRRRACRPCHRCAQSLPRSQSACGCARPARSPGAAACSAPRCRAPAPAGLDGQAGSGGVCGTRLRAPAALRSVLSAVAVRTAALGGGSGYTKEKPSTASVSDLPVISLAVPAHM